MIQTIGVIGGGQLGRMFAIEAKRMGYDVIVLDPQEHSPCGQVADEQIVATYDDMAAIAEMGRRTDIVTYEFENISIKSVEHLESSGYHVTPSSTVLRTRSATPSCSTPRVSTASSAATITNSAAAEPASARCCSRRSPMLRIR